MRLNFEKGFNSYYKKLEEHYLIEGTHYDNNAVKALINSGLFDESTSRQIEKWSIFNYEI